MLSGWLMITMQQQPATTVLFASAIVALGSSLGASVTYWLARLGGRSLVDRLMRKLHIKPQAMGRVERLFDKHGALLVLAARFLPGVRQLVNIPAGLARMPYWKFMSYSLIGSFFWSLLFIGAGTVLGAEWHRFSQMTGDAAPYALAVAALGGALALAIWLVTRRPWAKIPTR
jgi:membrane protein DedA with SNARE-associated domain